MLYGWVRIKNLLKGGVSQNIFIIDFTNLVNNLSINLSLCFRSITGQKPKLIQEKYPMNQVNILLI